MIEHKGYCAINEIGCCSCGAGKEWNASMICSWCRDYYVPEYYGELHGCAASKNFGVVMTPPETVNHPSHYTFGKYEVIDVLEDWFPEEPYLWQVGKYIARAGRKGEELEDLKKARWYLERKITRLERGEK